MIVTTRKMIDAINRLERIVAPRLKHEIFGTPHHTLAKTTINFCFNGQDELTIKAASDTQFFCEVMKVTPSLDEKAFTACVYPKTLSDVIKNADVTFEMYLDDKDDIRLDLGKRLKYKLENKREGRDFFDNLLKELHGAHVKINAIDLRDALSYCLHSTGNIFDYVSFRHKDDTLWVTGTDGYRAAFTKLGKFADELPDFDVDTKELSRLISVVPNDEIDVSLSFVDGKLFVWFENFYSWSLSYSNVKQDAFVILDDKPASGDFVFDVDLGLFNKAIKYLSSFTADLNGRIDVSLKDNTVKMFGRTEQLGDTTWILPIENGNLTGKEREIRMNSSFLNMYLSNAKPTQLAMHISEEENYPVHLVSEREDYVFLFMPMN